MSFATEQSVVMGEEVVRQVVGFLVGRSCWFQVMPLPDDGWLVVTKPEGHLQAALARFGDEQVRPPRAVRES